jgi:phenylpyruvate tautomerase PptA (4-oxalocrotonate tautomerase family)
MQAIAQRVTELYGKFMPKFYVVVVFLDVEPDSFYIGGKSNTRFVRIVSQHLART